MSALLERALAIGPASYETRAWALMSLGPRRGGSLDAMRGVALHAAERAGANPELGMLGGHVHVEQSRDAWSAGDTAAAFAHADSAVDMGPDPRFCAERAELELAVNLYAEAARDYRCAGRWTNLVADRLARRALADAGAAAAKPRVAWERALAAAAALADSALMLDAADSLARSIAESLANRQDWVAAFGGGRAAMQAEGAGP